MDYNTCFLSVCLCVGANDISGRVVSDRVNGGHMNASSVLLEGTRWTSQGRLVRLNLSQVKNYSLLPGQMYSQSVSQPHYLRICATHVC